MHAPWLNPADIRYNGFLTGEHLGRCPVKSHRVHGETLLNIALNHNETHRHG
jgi:hypothetical protein